MTVTPCAPGKRLRFPVSGNTRVTAAADRAGQTVTFADLTGPEDGTAEMMRHLGKAGGEVS